MFYEGFSLGKQNSLPLNDLEIIIWCIVLESELYIMNLIGNSNA